MGDLVAMMNALGQRAKAAAAALAVTPGEQRAEGLRRAAAAIRATAPAILAANERDVAEATGLTAATRDRLLLTPDRVEAIAAGLETVANLPDPLGRISESWIQPNGLRFERVSVPLGVIGIIYESRPNVTADAGGLCIKSGNAAILRGGSESFHSSGAILAALRQGLREAGLPEDAVQAVPTRDRDAVGLLLGLNQYVDVIVPRGGKSLIARVQTDSRVPVMAHLDGNCHLYLHRAADPAKAVALALNGKLRRTGVCGATESILADRAIATSVLAPVLTALLDAGCEVRGDAETQALDARIKPASDEDWATEYLDAILSVKQVDGLEQAIDHVNRFGSHHTDAIVTEDDAAAARFLERIDSAIVLHNASTQFADGGEFGFGAEIGIATGRLHARGPVGAAQLTSYKYRVHGTGQIRP